MTLAYPPSHRVSAAPPSAWSVGAPRPYREAKRQRSTAEAASAQHRASTKSLAANSPLPLAVMAAMVASRSDFRTVASLAAELGKPETDVRLALSLLGEAVRRPIGAERKFPDVYRISSRGLTRREKWWRFRSIAGRTSA